mmetsp:Transcript_28648/g.46110  ORF Transcript_28648/g.46110 Transcript_28648/m.46110 type:complete len:91 (+) Transcript_28648:454-726(+)
MASLALQSQHLRQRGQYCSGVPLPSGSPSSRKDCPPHLDLVWFDAPLPLICIATTDCKMEHGTATMKAKLNVNTIATFDGVRLHEHGQVD